MENTLQDLRTKFFGLFLFLVCVSCQTTNPDRERFKNESDWAKKHPKNKNQITSVSIHPKTPDPFKEKSDYSLEELLLYSYQNSSKLRAAKLKWEAALEKYPQVTSLPNPHFRYRYFYARGFQRSAVLLRQKIPFPSKLYYAGEITKEDARIAKYEFESQVNKLGFEIEKAYYDLLYLVRAIKLTKDTQTILGELLKLSQNQYSEDKAILLDVLKGEQQLAQLTYDLITLEEKKLTKEAKLNSLLNREPNAVFGIPKEVSFNKLHFSLKKLQHVGLRNQQELLVIKHRIKKAEQKVNRANQEYYPDFTLEMQYETEGSRLRAPQHSGRIAFLGVVMEIPIWVGKYRAGVREAKRLLEREIELQKDKEQSLSAKITKQYYLYKNSIRLIELYQNVLIPQAKQAMEVAENLYRDAQGSYSDYLETQLIWFNFNLAYHRSTSDAFIHKAMLESLVGIHLEVSDAKEN